MSRITITLHIDIPEGARVATPDVDYADSLPPEPPHLMAPPPPAYDPDEIAHPVVRQRPPDAPSCPTHGPMTFHAAGPNKAGTKQLSASYRCDAKDGDVFCKTKPVWLS